MSEPANGRASGPVLRLYSCLFQTTVRRWYKNADDADADADFLLTLEVNEILEVKRVEFGRTNLPKDEPECREGSPLMLQRGNRGKEFNSITIKRDIIFSLILSSIDSIID